MRLSAMGYEVTAVDSAEAALQSLDTAQPELVLSDLRMPGMDGLQLLQRLQVTRPALPVIILTAHGDVPEAVRATQEGAVAFLSKPVARDELEDVLQRYLPASVAEGAQAATANKEGDELSRNPRMLELLSDAKQVASSECTVLINGPSGAGKEVLARYIHAQSPRAQRPFVAMNCGAMPAELLESELFGHKKGAFTGATSDHLGLFRAAEGGTILLDEIGDMPAELQVKLLRVLEERRVRPVGESRTVAVDVRVLSATHRDLEDKIAAGEFREDLFYRLNVVRLRIPALEERREDIPALVQHKLQQLQQAGASKRVYAPEAMNALVAAQWPGNIRQLFNVVEQNVALAAGSVISLGQVEKALGKTLASSGGVSTLDEARDACTRDYLRQVLDITEGNVSQAARLAGRNRTDLYKLFKKFDLEPKSFKRRNN
jgi:two-component system response regulator GlrR